jgi:hypothetical protein
MMIGGVDVLAGRAAEEAFTIGEGCVDALGVGDGVAFGDGVAEARAARDKRTGDAPGTGVNVAADCGSGVKLGCEAGAWTG